MRGFLHQLGNLLERIPNKVISVQSLSVTQEGKQRIGKLDAVQVEKIRGLEPLKIAAEIALIRLL